MSFKKEPAHSDGEIVKDRKSRRKQARRLRRRQRRKRETNSSLEDTKLVEDVDANAVMHITCRHCQYRQEFPVNGGRSAWLDELESIAEICYME